MADEVHDGNITFGLFAVAKAGGEVRQLAGGASLPSPLAVHGDHVLPQWDETIVAVAKAGGELEIFAGDVYYADAMLVVDGELFVTSWMDGTLTRFDLVDGTATVVVRTEGDYPPLAPEAAGDHIYYGQVTSDGTRRIARTTRVPGTDEIQRVVGTQSPNSLSSRDILFAMSGERLLFVHDGELRAFGVQP